MSIADLEKKYNLDFSSLQEYNNVILEIFNGQITPEKCNIEDSNVVFLFGSYYLKVEKNYIEAIKYYLMAIDLGDSNSMYNLGSYYYDIEKNYTEAVKYFLMAIEHGNSVAMNSLGLYYDIEKNYPEAVKYYLMAIELENSDAMYNLGSYYYNIKKNYPEAVKYYLMAIEKRNSNAMNSLGYYYNNIEKNYPEAVKYWKMAIEHKRSEAMNNLELYYNSYKNIQSLYLLLHDIPVKNEIINNKLEELRKDNCINRLQHRLRYFERINKIEECIICKEEKLSIEIGCGHETCSFCYVKLKKCPLCDYIIHL